MGRKVTLAAAAFVLASLSTVGVSSVPADGFHLVCRVTESMEAYDGAEHLGFGDAKARKYRISIWDGRARAVVEIWGVAYSTGWMDPAYGDGDGTVRYSGTAGGRRVRWPLLVGFSLWSLGPGGAEGKVTAFQDNGGVTVTDTLSCETADRPLPVPNRSRTYANLR